ncbi:hypothetical protein QOZ80_7AG0559200 [Eleusine coracana subsp. coracana]|nr:hypothetical protein QOZ80_7AG0559200 [Eleusine coracana subsp. coracana]
MEGIVSIIVFPNRKHELLTTRSWDFLGLPQRPQEALPLEWEFIVGMIDTGVWPDSSRPSPTRTSACRRADGRAPATSSRAYNLGATGMSPLDHEGDGIHTASIVAGRAVGNVSFDSRLASGAVPGVWLAVYKVCWEHRCDLFLHRELFPGTVLRGHGGHRVLPRHEAWCAHLRRGGNFGHVCNVAPWMLSITASSIDRRFVDFIAA